ncbi:trimethylamine methyltransferase family protein [Thioclava sp. FR2]|uniref:trimethylamine methyltransferase family protein n=1 Tax=Thioclava sp. FR2 TaxID=3445780 RepID=UPI003EBFB7F1
MRASAAKHERLYAQGQLLFGPGAGCPNVTDRLRGRRPGSLESFDETIRLQQAFDVIHILGPSAEPQDVPAHFRHYAMMESQMALATKPMFIYARGRGQVEDCFKMIRLGLDLSEEDWAEGSWCYTVINTNSPRQLDLPMAQGIIDFARHGQMAIITPFCLAGAMAPVTVQGALVLQHAEALAGITLAQMTKPGAPVSYGGFASNVDLKSGSPAFGTPEMIRLQIGSGQLARHISLPWRSASGAASNVADMQAGLETSNGLWGAMQANATLVVHAAGWLEGGLCFGYEKFINDVEACQMLAELCAPLKEAPEELALDALAEVPPGGHFFAAEHTMARYEQALYAPLVADLSNHGNWLANGGQTSTERATAIWQKVLETQGAQPKADAVKERLARFVEARKAEGGAPPQD